MIKNWENIIKVMKYFEKFPKSKQPSSKSFLNVQKAANDVFSPAKFQFFSFVAKHFKPFLTSYQTDAPMIPGLVPGLGGSLAGITFIDY